MLTLIFQQQQHQHNIQWCGECLKVFTATMIVFWTENDPVGALRKELVGNWRTTLKVGIPAFLYTLQNNLLYYALSQLDATVYQVLYQVKLLTTAMFSVVLLQRSFSTVRWVSLGVLALGVALVQVSGMKKNGDEEGSCSRKKNRN